MNLNKFLILFSIVLFSCQQEQIDEEPERPNIIIILTDDQGYGDVSCLNPDSKIETANFDRLLARSPNLRWVHSATAGVERVLTADAAARGLMITNARGVFSEPIAEYTIMMILSVLRRLPELFELQGERTWQPLPAPSQPWRLPGSNLGNQKSA